MTNEGFDLVDRRSENELSTKKPQQAEELFTLDDLIADILDGFTPNSEPKSCTSPEPQITHSGKVYGIDLGSGNSCIAQISESGLPMIIRDNENYCDTLPSAIYFESGNEAIFGEEAIESGDIDAYNNRSKESPNLFRNWKKWLGREEEPGAPVYEAFGRRYTPTELTTMLLKKIAAYAEESTGDRVKNVVLTHPVWYDSHQKYLLREAAAAAGMNVVDMLSEPVAAALCRLSADSESTEKRVMVCDLGYSGFDAAILELKREGDASLLRVLTMDGYPYLGCMDWNDRLYELLLWKFCDKWGYSPEEVTPDIHLEIRMRTEGIIKKFSHRENTACKFRDYNGIRIDIEISSDEFESAASDLKAHLISIADDMLARRGLSADDIDEVLCVGGGMKMPMVYNAFTARFGEKAILFEPEFAVTKGAAIYGSNMNGFRIEKSDPYAEAGDDIIV